MIVNGSLNYGAKNNKCNVSDLLRMFLNALQDAEQKSLCMQLLRNEALQTSVTEKDQKWWCTS